MHMAAHDPICQWLDINQATGVILPIRDAKLMVLDFIEGPLALQAARQPDHI